MKTTDTAAKETIVTVACPRCGGKGRQDYWHPDHGVCYLCQGRRALEVNIERSERYLAVLRREYRAARDEGDEERMLHLATKGSQKRALVDAAKAEIEARKAAPIPVEPPAGSWAAVARMMAAGDDSGMDWDAWKDQMKERG